MVTITAIVFLNFNRFCKKSTIGLPIREITTAIEIYTKTDSILYKK